MSKALEKAREYERMAERQVQQDERPAFHISPRIGWLNDPNGLSYYDGKYHLFYQYHPYNTHWGPMHWGHVVSSDMIKWEYLPVVMAPDHDYDIDGCFSGDAITLTDGRHMIMYTGFVRDTDDIEGSSTQTQNLAFGNGIDYVKYEGNPVITAAMIPGSDEKCDFRDPVIWQDEQGYHSVAAYRGQSAPTQIVMFESKDGLDWNFEKVLMENYDKIGLMWECPNYFDLDGKKVLLVSAMDMLADGMEFHSGNNCIYFLGEEDSSTGKLVEECCHTLDDGIDFYATQTIETEDGRRVILAWMQNPDTAALRTRRDPLFGQMTIPRELSIKDGKLIQQPIREIENYRHDEVRVEDFIVDGRGFFDDVEIPGIHGRYVDMEVELSPVGDGSFNKFRCRFAKNDKFFTEFRFSADESLISIDRKYSGQRRAVIRHRDAAVKHEGGKLKFRIILDRYSAEIFVNDGQTVMTTTFVTDLDADRITFGTDGKVKLNITKYCLK